MTEKNPHIRTDTSPEREAHLRVLADQGDNALRDALAMATEARTERDEARKERDSAWVLLKQAIRRESEEPPRCECDNTHEQNVAPSVSTKKDPKLNEIRIEESEVWCSECGSSEIFERRCRACGSRNISRYDRIRIPETNES